MSEIQESVAGDDQPEVTATRSQDTLAENSTEAVPNNHKDDVENGISRASRTEDRGRELPELITDKEERKDVMPGLPYINLSELAIILRDPSMPSHKIMKEVAEKMMLKSEESESDDGSFGSSGGVGMKGLLDCIFEVTFQHTDSDNSDEDDDSFERIPREIPCSFCNKVFGSTMTWKTHVLVAHQDPSVLNIRRRSATEADRKEKSHPAHRRHSRSTSKTDSDSKNTKARHASKTDTREIAEAPHGEKNVLVGKKYSSVSRSHQNEKSSEFSPKHQVDKEPVPTEKGVSYGAASNYSGELTEDVVTATNEPHHNITVDPLQFPETNLRDYGSAERRLRLQSPTKDETESHEFHQIIQVDQSSQKSNIVGNTSIPTESLTCESEGGRKRRATSPVQESSPSPASLSDPKRSRKVLPE